MAADLIICGRQTTDGDTAQVGPRLRNICIFLIAAWVTRIDEVTEKDISVQQKLGDVTQVSRIPFPCLITVEKDMCVPRLPSWILKKKTADRKVRFLSFEDLPNQDLTRYGLNGSPTAVERMFPPEKGSEAGVS